MSFTRFYDVDSPGGENFPAAGIHLSLSFSLSSFFNNIDLGKLSNITWNDRGRLLGTLEHLLALASHDWTAHVAIPPEYIIEVTKKLHSPIRLVSDLGNFFADPFEMFSQELHARLWQKIGEMHPDCSRCAAAHSEDIEACRKAYGKCS